MPFNIPTPIYNAVKPYAGSVPDVVWENVVYTESRFDPNAYNKAGAYGLFQLLYPGGQGATAIAAGHTTQDLFNPSINAQYGMPAVANTWSGLAPSFDDSLFWWEKFAAQSGHPGGSPGQAYTDQVAQTLKSNYDANKGGAAVASTDPWSLFWNNVLSNLASPGSAFGNASSATSKANAQTGPVIAKAVTDPGSLLSQATSPLTNIAIYVGVFIVALVIIIIGFMALQHE
jgi:Transglycosylase SLT domain